MKLHTGEIIKIKLSSTENNLVTSGVDKTVKYLIWPSNKPLKELYYSEPVKVESDSSNIFCFILIIL